MILEVAIDLHCTQHQQIDVRVKINAIPNKVFKPAFGEPLTVAFPDHLHALRHGVDHLITQHWNNALISIAQEQLLTRTRQ
ncbi:hypothetical protein D3C76_1496920 [compost metagenome]